MDTELGALIEKAAAALKAAGGVLASCAPPARRTIFAPAREFAGGPGPALDAQPNGDKGAWR
jgi:hypothetical protein